MDFLIFGLYYLIYSIISCIIFLIFRKFLFKRACVSVSKEVEKSLDDFFNSYDNSEDIINKIDYDEWRSTNESR